MEDLPRLRPRQCELLQRFIDIEQRLESQHAEGDRTIRVVFSINGPLIAKPEVADGHIDRGDLHAVRAAGAFDVHSWTSDMAVVRVSQIGYDLAERHRQLAGGPTPDALLGQYRSRRRLLASRLSLVARWLVLLLGVAVVVASAVTGSWIYAVIGVVGAVFGIPVTGVALWVDRRLTGVIDRWLLRYFESERLGSVTAPGRSSRHATTPTPTEREAAWRRRENGAPE